MKKRFLVSFLMTFLLFSVASLPVFAANCAQDYDNDRWYGDTSCELPLGAKGFEESKCDGEDGSGSVAKGQIDCTSAEGSMVCNAAMAGNSINGRNINPNAIEKADNGIDENCDGKDGKLIPGDNNIVDINSYVEKVINILSSVVAGVSVAVLIWGGIMFATAAGSDDKIRKAKKTMLGALVGLVVALSAWVIVGFVVNRFVS